MKNNLTKGLVNYLRNSHSTLIFTGAGISTGSGIPDFRGPQGVWKRRQPVYFQDFLASEESRIEYWEYKSESWNAFRDAGPNATHRVIVDLERAGKLLMVITQNVDGLHAKAGTSAEKLVELHGTNSVIECLDCGRRSDPDPHFEYFRQHRKPPLCKCGGFLKPATISFGQNLRQGDIARAAEAAEKADLVVALGSTLSVTPAANIPLLATQRGVPYIIINRGETDHDRLPALTLRLKGDVTEIFPPAVAAVL
jgi:NAD-dependent deacetylase